MLCRRYPSRARAALLLPAGGKFETYYSAYVSQQNLLSDIENGPVNHPDIDDVLTDSKKVDISCAEAYN